MSAPVTSVAVFLGVAGPGSKHLRVEGINLHEKLSKKHKEVINILLQGVF